MTSTHTSVRRRLPSAADLDARTGDRDRVVDLIRIFSLVVVIAGHSLMLTVTADDAAVHLGNLLADVPVLQAATWLLQVLPLFFFAGAAAATCGLTSRPSQPPGHWLLTRAQRLLRPVFWYLLAVGAVLLVAHAADAKVAADLVAGLGVQLLWFLGAYLLVLAIVPLLQRITTTMHAVGAVAVAWAATAGIDGARLTLGWEALGAAAFVTVWVIPAIIGVAYARGVVSPALGAGAVVSFLLVDIALVAFGPYEVSLVTVPGQSLSNMNPPTLLLAGHAIVLCGLAIALRTHLARAAARPRVWWWVALGNRGAMTLYLWHLPVLALLIGGGELLGWSRDRSPDGMYAALIGSQTVLLLALMVPVVALLAQLENRPLRWWDATAAGHRGRARDAAVLVTLVVVAVAILMTARTGLVGDGWSWVMVAVVGAVVARTLDEPSTAVPHRRQRSTCAASPKSARLPL
ncbi:MAG: acyltransferase family protein [Actinomycetota bacterium]|nr:acyltransferase family protein [Actinomycetota bacterium]